MGTAVIPSRDTSPALQPAECISNKMSFLYSVLSKENALFLVLRGGMQTVIPLALRFPQPTRVITSVCQKRTGIGKKVLENGCTLAVADLPFSQQTQDGTPMPVTNDMEFGIQATFCSSNETWRIPFLSRLAAVR